MLTVKTIEEIYELINDEFKQCNLKSEKVSLLDALGRTLNEDIVSKEYVPSFNRSTVDGYALISSDTFGCSDSIPAILTKTKEILMGDNVELSISPMLCSPIPTGGHLPKNANGVQMIEFSEDYGDGTVGILKSVAPGQNIIFKGDDVKPEQIVLKKGRVLSSHDIGALAALGYDFVSVIQKPLVGIISTGNELINIEQTPKDGQIRDVNSSLVATAIMSFGATPRCYGIISDKESLLEKAIEIAVTECDMVLISGGSSIGTKDATFKVIEKQGDILAHGIALKPGKPTILGKISNKPIVGLPGHPVAAFYVTQLVVSNILEKIFQLYKTRKKIKAILGESIESNHGRTQCVGITMENTSEANINSAAGREVYNNSITVMPIRTKSGLITTLAGTDGYIVIPRDSEGLPKNSEVTVYIY